MQKCRFTTFTCFVLTATFCNFLCPNNTPKEDYFCLKEPGRGLKSTLFGESLDEICKPALDLWLHLKLQKKNIAKSLMLSSVTLYCHEFRFSTLCMLHGLIQTMICSLYNFKTHRCVLKVFTLHIIVCVVCFLKEIIMLRKNAIPVNIDFVDATNLGNFR